MCWGWICKRRQPGADEVPLVEPRFVLVEGELSSTGEEPDTIPLLTLNDVFASDDERDPGVEPLFPECRICLEPVVEARDDVEPRAAFGLEDDAVFVPLCDCTRLIYHVGCLRAQLEAWSNRDNWDRMCDVCHRAWKFMPGALPGNFDAPLHRWVAWEAPGQVFRVRVRDGEGGFGDNFIEGVELRVGPGTASTPAGPVVPMADAYATVEVVLPEPHTGPYAIYFNGNVGRRVPWTTVYLLFFGSSGGT